MEEKHFFVVHTFVSDEARKEFLTPPEKRIPPEKRKTEEEWAKSSAGEFAKCVRSGLAMMNSCTVIGSLRANKMFTGNSMNGI